jgi:hypothetical protein
VVAAAVVVAAALVAPAVVAALVAAEAWLVIAAPVVADAWVVAAPVVGVAAAGDVAVLSPHAASNNKPTNRAAKILPAARYLKIAKMLNSF